MKYILTFLLLCCYSLSHAQLTPSVKAIDKQWIKEEAYRMAWYMVRDTAQIQIGTVSTHLTTTKDRLTAVTSVAMKGMKGDWVDSTVCVRNTLEPIRHASYNMQRDMVLNFGKVVTGFYRDKLRKKDTPINDTTRTPYFDSNLYPILIRWLPLKQGFTQKIAIYDYNPSAKIGVITASVGNVSSGTYASKTAGLRNVWVVDVTDEIGNGKSTYFIDKANRRLWKQTMEANGRTMVMVVIE
ncbi:hypothetical protein [uncultured Fibrella sp.]|uniref:DUF3108 domain-containing protein n=1 Tax=uncultured Fibrella sp. TaxID=1284596 RepID=UPI0035CB4DF5